LWTHRVRTLNFLRDDDSDVIGKLILLRPSARIKLPAYILLFLFLACSVGDLLERSRVTSLIRHETALRAVRMMLDRRVAAAKIRDDELRPDIALAQEVADIRGGGGRLVRHILKFIEVTPTVIWYDHLSVGENTVLVDAEAPDIQSIASMMHRIETSTPRQHAQLRSVMRHVRANASFMNFTLSVKEGGRRTDVGHT